MPKVSQIVNAYVGGELAPEIQGRTDIAKYHTGAASIENFIVHPEGGLFRRPGSQFVAGALDDSKRSRLIPFTFSTEQAYILEFSDLKIRVYANELQVQVEEHDLSNPNTTVNEFTFEDHGYVRDQGPFHITATAGIPTGLAVDTDYFIHQPQARSFNSTGIDNATDTIDFGTAHGYIEEQGPFRVVTTSGGHLTVLLEGFLDYFVLVFDSTKIQISLTPGGAAVNFSTVISPGTHEFVPTGDYLRDKFGLSLTAGGAQIDITTSGTAPHTFTPNPDGTPTGLPLDIPTPFPAADLFGISHAQSADFLFMAHPNHAPTQLTRSGATQWALDFIDITDGPYGPEFLSDDAQVDPSAATGQIHIDVTKGDLVWGDEHLGTPVRILNGSDWGYAVIHSFDVALNRAQALVIVDFASSAASDSFRIGSWGAGNFPRAVSLFEQRLAFAGESLSPQTFHASNTNAFARFSPTEFDKSVLDTNALQFVIGTNQINAIRWMAVGTRLTLGTSNALFSVRGSLDGEPVTPTNIQIQRITSFGALSVQPVTISDQVVYVTENSQGLRGFRLDTRSDSVVPTDITLLAKHIFGRTDTVRSMAYQQDRQQVLWCVMAQGTISSVTYIPEQEVFAWHRHKVGGNFSQFFHFGFTSSEVDTSQDTIDIGVSHGLETGQGPFFLTTTVTLPGGLAVLTHYFIEKVSDTAFKFLDAVTGDVIDITSGGSGTHGLWELEDALVESVAAIPSPAGTHDQVWLSVKRTVNGSTVRHIEFFEDEWFSDAAIDMRFLDSAPQAFSGSPTSSVSELDHLEGEIVQVLADGAVHPDRIVSGGAITLDAAYSDVLVGLGYTSSLQTLRIVFPDEEGNAMGKKARIDHLVFRLFNSIGGEFGPNGTDWDPIVTRDSMAPMDNPTDPFTGDIKVGFESDHRRETVVYVRQTKPLSFNLLSMNIFASTGQR